MQMYLSKGSDFFLNIEKTIFSSTDTEQQTIFHNFHKLHSLKKKMPMLNAQYVIYWMFFKEKNVCAFSLSYKQNQWAPF